MGRDRAYRRGRGTHPAGSAADRVTSSSQMRILSSLRARCAASSFAMPLTNGSQPMKPIVADGPAPGRRDARRRQSRSRATISRRDARNRSPGGSMLRAARRRAGNSVWTSSVLAGPQLLALAAPEKGAGAIGRLIVGHAGCRAQEAAAERVGEIGPLPGEAAIGIRRAAEMAVGGGAGIDRPVEAEMLADAARRQVHDIRQHLPRAASSSTLPVPCRST